MENKGKRSIAKYQWLGIILTGLMLLGYTQFGSQQLLPFKGNDESEQPMGGEICPMPSKVPMVAHEKIQYILNDKEYRDKSSDLLSKAVQVDTIVFDDMEMSDYAKMAKFHEYLEENFPSVYERAKVSKINQYGLIFEFEGSNKDLKPILLMAHQDTVPIGDPNDWLESPFSGRIDESKVFGRGATDCKTLLVSLMETFEMVIQNGEDSFERGFILSFGFDEEKSGFDGAYHLGQHLLQKYGPDSIDHIIDEGPMMFSERFGDYYAMIPTGEKGYIDLTIDITTPGGHSSNPKAHTSIGMMSKLLVAYEEDPFEPMLSNDSPMLGLFECVGEHGKLPKDLADAAKKARFDSKANKQLTDFIASQDNEIKWLVSTTQAIDIIDGGDKANALPRAVRATINHRITYGQDEFTIWDKCERHGRWISKKYGLGLEVNGKVIFPSTENGNLVFSTQKGALRTATATPLYDDIYNDFTGTIKTFYEEEVYPELFAEQEDKQLIIAPAIMTGNTDTRHYWDLTDHIFRVQPGSMDFMNANIHGPNEYTEIDSHLQQVAFYYNYVLAHK